jgi:TonB family protein
MHPAAEQSLLYRKSAPALGRFVAISVGAHVLFLALLLGAGLLPRGKPIDLDQKPINASLVRLGKPRDQKLLPRKEEAPPPPKQVEAAKPTPVPTTPPTTTVPSPLAKPAQPAAQQDGAKSGEDRRKQLFSAFSKAGAKADELEGQLDGDPLGDSAIQEGERYYGALAAQVRRYYDVAQTISEQERLHLRADVLFVIDRGGQVTRVAIAKSSGNELFDSAVLAAVKRAAPFGPPPDHLRESLQKAGIVIGFKP